MGEGLPVTASQRRLAARTLVAGRDRLTVLAAMWPQQPDRLLGAIVEEARAAGTELTLLVADLSGAFGFLADRAELTAGSARLRIVPLAGAVPAGLGPLVDPFPGTLADAALAIARGDLRFDAFVARVHRVADDDVASMGAMVAYTPEALAVAETVIVELCPAVSAPASQVVPLARAASVIAVADADAPRPLRTGELDEEQREVARSVASLVPAGATLQLGLGAIPEGVPALLPRGHGVRFHSGILPAALADYLALDAGAGPHMAIGTMPGASAPWPASVSLRSISQIHAPAILLGLTGLWAVNSAFEVDLSGRVNAERVGGARVAMGGGQADFFRAAHASATGASVLALPSRSRSGRARIVAAVPGPSTAFPADLDVVVTEQGVARLAGLTEDERAQALIAVAHPGDRDGLRSDWLAVTR